MTDKTKTDSKAPKFKINDRVRITKHKNIFIKNCTENWSREIFITNFIFETNSWTYKFKDVNGEKLIRSFYEKELLLII